MHQQVRDHWDAIRWLKIYGYLPEVQLKDVCKEKGRRLKKSAAVRDALRLAQCAMYDETQMGCPDGVLGECTMSGMSLARCAHPDFADEELVKAAEHGKQWGRFAKYFNCNPDEFKTHVEHHAALAAVGSGSWPQPCQKNGIVVDWDTSRAPRGLDTDKLFHMTAEAYWDIGFYLKMREGDEKAHIRNWWVVLAGSTIGIAQFNSRSCSRSPVTCRLDPGYFPSLLQVAELLKHEWGHNCNLQHTRGGTMNPSILRVNDIAWARSDPSFRTLQRFAGGEPVGPNYPGPDGPGPGPDPNPGPDVGHGWFFAGRNMYALKVGEGNDGRLNFKGESHQLDVTRIA